MTTKAKVLALLLAGTMALSSGVSVAAYTPTIGGEMTVSSVSTQSVKLSKSLTLGVGETYFTEEGTYKSSNGSVASIDSNGTITAKKIGTTTITGKTASGSQVSCKLTVKAAPTSVKLNSGNFTLGVGETFTIKQNSPSNCYANAFTWSSSNSSVATIAKDKANRATIKAVGVGTTTISVTTYNGKTASLTLTVKAAPQSVNLNTGNFTLGVGEKFTIAESTNSGSYAKAFTWSSSNSSVATITKDKANKAIITANKVGTTNITVKLYNGVTKTIKLTVKKAPTSVKINTGNFTLGVGEKFEIKQNSPSDCYAKGFTWSSSNSSVATVTKGSANRAEVVAKKVGTANITIKTYNGKTATIKVTVKKAPTSVKINTGNLTLDIGKTAEIKQNSPSDCYAKEFTWSSSNPAVATVTKGSANKATVKAVSAGTANITITTYNGKTATIKVTVNGPQKPTDPVTDPTTKPTDPIVKPTEPPTEAPTEKVWVVDEPATTKEVEAYYQTWRNFCNGCGEDITDNNHHTSDYLAGLLPGHSTNMSYHGETVLWDVINDVPVDSDKAAKYPEDELITKWYYIVDCISCDQNGNCVVTKDSDGMWIYPDDWWLHPEKTYIMFEQITDCVDSNLEDKLDEMVNTHNAVHKANGEPRDASWSRTMVVYHIETTPEKGHWEYRTVE